MYSWIKAFHVIAVISWMAGMLYLPRLFVYHCDAEPGSKQSETFKTMEQRLFRIIINPAMIITLLTGGWLVWEGRWYSSLWFQAKFALVLAMLAAHGFFAARLKDFALDRNTKSQKFYRIINEIPTISHDLDRDFCNCETILANAANAGLIPHTSSCVSEIDFLY